MLLDNQPPGAPLPQKPATAATSCADSTLPERCWLGTTVLNRDPRTGCAVNGDAGDPGVPTAPCL